MEEDPPTTDPAPTPEAEPKKPGRKRKHPPVELEIPVRLLHVVGVAAKEDGKYQMAGVMVETRDEKSLVSATSTDGRRMMVAECNRGMFDGVAEVYVPKLVAHNAARIAIARPQDDKTGAVVTLRRKGDECHLTAYTLDGPVVFEWQQDPDLVFPPCRDVIPDWSDSVGVASVGITPELVASTLRTLQKVVGKDPKVRVYLPPSSDRPIGLESQDGDSIKALAVVMPADIGDWMQKPQQIGAGERKADADTDTAPLPFSDDGWKSVRLDSLLPAIKPSKLAILSANNPPILTMGDLSDWQAAKGDWWARNIKGLGNTGVEQLDAATAEYWKANPVTTAAKETGNAGSVTITTSGGTSATMPLDEFAKFDVQSAARNVTTGDGRKITTGEMAEEISAGFKAGKY